ncbi:MAG: class I SAM-dependent methyltransferase [bacterium]
MSNGINSFYNKFSICYDFLITLLAFFAGGEKKYRNKIVDLAEIQKGERILDLCCGTGTLTKLISQRLNNSGMVIGIDYSDEMIELAREKSKDIPNIKYNISDGRNLPFKNLSFDKVFICMALHEMLAEHRKMVIGEMYRVLKNDGVGIFIEFDQPEKPCLRYKLIIKIEEFWDKEALEDFKKTNLQKELKEAGFIITKTELTLGNCIRIMVARKRF